MRYGEVQSVDIPICRPVQGTVIIGSENAERSFDLLVEVRELGCTAFDTYPDELCVGAYCFEDNFARFERALARDRGLSVSQVALAYVLGQPLDVFALVSCNTGEEFADNVTAAAVSLTPEETSWLKHGDVRGEAVASSA